MPNALAFLMLLIWPLVSLALFLRLSPASALVWTILGGYLLLPPLASFDLPMIPDLDKFSIANLSALVCVLFVLKDRGPWLPESRIAWFLMALFVLGPFGTVVTNTEPMRLAVGELPGMRLYDSLSVIANQGIAILPFFLARRLLATPEAMRALLVALVVAGLAYSLPMLVEVRLSPQINVWVYGFFQHDFGQMIRFGGFRPIVFLPHGLWAAFFMVMCVVASLVMLRIGPAQKRPKALMISLYLGAVLVLCKSVGPMAYALVLAPTVLFARRRWMLMMAGSMALIAITFPLLRGADLIPTKDILEVAEMVNPDREQSLRFRFDNEDILLEHANKKPLFGWGGYARNHIYDPYSAKRLTIADGSWIITMGIFGWLGYIAQFGLLSLPLLALGREAWRRHEDDFSLYVCTVALILGTNMIDMLPNATVVPFTWLMAGALLGHAERLSDQRREHARSVLAARSTPRPRRTVI